MLKKLAFILVFPTILWIFQVILTVADKLFPIAISPMLAILYPAVCLFYGYLTFRELKYWNIVVCLVSLCIFFVWIMMPVSILFSIYFILMTFIGCIIRKKAR